DRRSGRVSAQRGDPHGNGLLVAGRRDDAGHRDSLTGLPHGPGRGLVRGDAVRPRESGRRSLLYVSRSAHPLRMMSESAAALAVRRPQPASTTVRLARELRHNAPALAVVMILTLFAALAVAAPLLPIQNPNGIATQHRLEPPFSPGHVLGTDEFGRDLLSRLVWGGRVSLLAGLGSMLGALVIGTAVGLLAGFYGGGLDRWIMRLTEILQAFPYILLAIAPVAAPRPGPGNAMP